MGKGAPLEKPSHVKGARGRGLYISANIGVADVDGGDAFRTNITEVPNIAFDHKIPAGPITLQFLVGYQFNRNIAAELGLIHLPTNEHRGEFFVNALDIPDNTVNSYRLIKSQRNRAIDLMAKFMVPIVDRFVIFVKGGGAYVHTETKFGTGFTFLDSSDDNKNITRRRDEIRPIYSVGASYIFNDHITGDFMFTHLISWGSNSITNTFDNTITEGDIHIAIPSSYSLTLGITAHLFKAPKV